MAKNVRNQGFKDFTFEERIEQREEKKRRSLRFMFLLKEMKRTHRDLFSDKLIDRVESCGSFLSFIGNHDLSKTKLATANFCNNRFCPHCAFNKSKKDALDLYLMVESLSDEYEFLFLTLTAPNVKGEELNEELKEYAKAFRNFVRRKDFKKAICGYVRKLEVTYNVARDDYHPHYHILLAVKKEYFDKDKDIYISRDKYLEMWQESKMDNNINQVDIRVFDKKKDTAILEMSKYLAKDSNYLHSADVLHHFYKALKGKRLYSYEGVFKDARRKLKNGDLDYLKERDNVIYIYKIWFIWQNGRYENVDGIQALTPDELEIYNKDYIEDVDIDI